MVRNMGRNGNSRSDNLRDRSGRKQDFHRFRNSHIFCIDECLMVGYVYDNQ